MTSANSFAPNIVVQPEKFMLVVGVNEDCNVQVTNVGFNPVIFRVLTTGQNRYLVRHTKGYIKGNESAQFTITLNRQHLFDNCPPDTKILKDDFRVECVYVSPEDVIDSKLTNVPQIIKDRKAANKDSVARKMLRCHVMLEGSDANNNMSAKEGNEARTSNVMTKTREENMNALAAQNAGRGNTSSNNNTSSSSKMTSQQLEQNTLEQQRKRKSQQKSGFLNSFRLIIIISLIVAMSAAWYYGSN